MLLAQTGVPAVDVLIVYAVVGAVGFALWRLIRIVAPPLVFAVFRRNIVSYFSNPIAYVFIIAFTIAAAFFQFWYEGRFFADNICDFAQLNAAFPLVLLFFIPAITMSIWAEERKTGTEELLLTLPGSDFQIVLGKYLASVAIYSAALVFFGPLYFFLAWLGRPDGGLILANFLGYWLIGAALISAGMVASLLTSNVTVAFILGAAVCSLLVVPHYLVAGVSLNRDVQAILTRSGMVEQLEPFSRGVISFHGLVYFVGVTVVMLYLNVVLLSRRHWEGGEGSAARWVHYGLRTASLFVVAVALTLAARTASSRFAVDATAERLHTLSPRTEQLVKELDPKRPVLIEAFLSPDPPKEYVKTRRDLVDVLERFRDVSGGKIQLDVRDTEPFSRAAAEAERVYKIKPEQVQVEEDSRRGVQQVFMGIAFKSGLNEKVIPFFWHALPVEYELARMIRAVSEVDRKKVGVLTTDAKLFGDFDTTTFQPIPSWLIINELEQQYDVVRVSPDSDYPDDLRVLVVPMASSLTDPQLDRLVAHVKNGGPTLILDDPMPAMNPSLAANRPKTPPRSPMFGMPPQGVEPKGNLAKLTNILNIRFDASNVVWQKWNPVSDIQDLPEEFVFIGPDSGNPDAFSKHVTTSGLQQLVAILPGYVQETGGDGPTFTPLLTTGVKTGLTRYDDVFTENPFGGMAFNPNPKRRPTGRPYVLAALIQGKPAGSEAVSSQDEGESGEEKPKSKEIQVIFISDLDVMGDQMFHLRQQVPKESLRFDNVAFLLNCVDYLAGDTAFLDLRKKRPQRRTLSTIEAMLKESQTQLALDIEKAQQEFDDEIEKAEKQLRDEVAKIEKDPSIPPHLRGPRLEVARSYWEKELNRKKDEAQRKLNDRRREILESEKRARRQLEQRVKLAAVLIPPIPALLIGLVVLVVRRNQETVGADAKRLV